MALGLGVLGLVVRPPVRGARLVSVALIAAGVILAWGPYALIGGELIPLPYRWLTGIVPGFASMRYPSRFFCVVVVGLAGLVALGLARVRHPALAAGMVALLLWESGTAARMAVRDAVWSPALSRRSRHPSPPKVAELC